MIKQLLEATRDNASHVNDRVESLAGMLHRRGIVGMTPTAKTEMWQHLDVPVRLANRLPEDLQFQVAARLATDKQMLIREWDGQVRAVVSDDYTCLPHSAVAQALSMVNDVQVVRFYPAAVDEFTKAMHIRCIFPRNYVFATGDVGNLMMHITNSEVGRAALRVKIGIYRLVCTNGLMAWREVSTLLSQRHIYKSPEEMLYLLNNALVSAPAIADEFMEMVVSARNIGLTVEETNHILARFQLPKYVDDVVRAELPQKTYTLYDMYMALTRGAQAFDNYETQVAVEERASSILYKPEMRSLPANHTTTCPVCGK